MNIATPEPDVLARFHALLGQLERWHKEMDIALRHGRYTHSLDDVIGLIIANHVHFYSFDDAFVVMELITYPQFKVYHCFLAGGIMDAVLAATEPMSKVATALGCKYISMAGRDGWQKVLKQRDWKFVCTTMYLELERPEDERRQDIARPD